MQNKRFPAPTEFIGRSNDGGRPSLPSFRRVAIVRAMPRRALHLIATVLALVLSAQVATATACEVACLLGLPDSSARTVSDSTADCHATDAPYDGARVDGNATGCQHAVNVNPVPAERVRSEIKALSPGITSLIETSDVVFLHDHSSGALTNDPPGSHRGRSGPLRL